MRIIINSDIIYTKRQLATGLPEHIDRFCRDAAPAGAILVVPRTVLLESERNQQRQAEEAIAAIDNAVALLRRWGVELPEVEAQRLVAPDNLVALLRATGITVEIEEPLLEDYQEAERRACLHLSPQPPGTKADEMRDLVIWAVALRLARRHGRAILVSRDEVHSHERGEEEAEANGLRRAKSLDEALEFLGRETPSGALVRSVLGAVWNGLRATGLPLPADVSLRSATDLAFSADDEGRALLGRFNFSVNATGGQLSARADVFQTAPNQIRTELRDVTLNGRPWEPPQLTCLVDGELPRILAPAGPRLRDLKGLVGAR